MPRLSDLDYMRLAYSLAALSEDPSTQNGAIVVASDGAVIGRGFNRFVTGVPCDHKRLDDRSYKYPRTSHAEKLAIFAALRRGNALELEGATLYCPWFACESCSKDILEAGISEVVGHVDHPGNLAPHSRWPADVINGLTNLKEAGVVCRYLEGSIEGHPIRVNYQLWQP